MQTFSYQTLPDNVLVTLVRDKQDSLAFKEIESRHSGAYLTVVNRYQSSGIAIDDIREDRTGNIYDMVCSYRTDSPMKLSTYIYRHTEYLCYRECKKANRYTFVYSDDPDSHEQLADSEEQEDRDAHHVFTVDKEAILNEIKSHKDIDPLFIKIVELRILCPKGAKPASWRECGKQLGVSYEWCRLVFNKYKYLLNSLLDISVTPNI
jgi:hypothetical protein